MPCAVFVMMTERVAKIVDVILPALGKVFLRTPPDKISLSAESAMVFYFGLSVLWGYSCCVD
jgi:hypothetical protein